MTQQKFHINSVIFSSSSEKVILKVNNFHYTPVAIKFKAISMPAV